jgi:glycosyltransferase involved in cell wall biosynthesis
MRVLLFIQLLELGGSEKQCVEMARLLTQNGYDVTVGCMRKSGPLREKLEQAGIPIVEFSVGSLLRPRALIQMVRLAKFIRRNKFNVVQANDVYSTLFAVPAARLAGTPVVISSQRDLSEWSWYTPRRRRILRAVQRMSTWILVNSEAIRSYLVADDGMDGGKIRVVYNGIDAERFASVQHQMRDRLPGISATDRLVAVVGNMHLPVKGHSDLIAAAETVCRQHPTVRFLLIGDGEMRRQFEAQSRAAGLEHSISFLGHRTDIPEILSCCEIGVLASRAEGLPNAVLEYMAAGLATVATPVGGVPEIIQHGVNGLLVPAKDPAALSAALCQLLNDDQLRERLSRAARQSVLSKFSFANLFNNLRQLYQAPSPKTLNIRQSGETVAVE